MMRMNEARQPGQGQGTNSKQKNVELGPTWTTEVGGNVGGGGTKGGGG